MKLERPNLSSLVRDNIVDSAAELHCSGGVGKRENVSGQQRLLQNRQDYHRELHQPKCTNKLLR